MDILVNEQRRDENYIILLYDMILSNPVSSASSSSSALPPHSHAVTHPLSNLQRAQTQGTDRRWIHGERLKVKH